MAVRICNGCGGVVGRDCYNPVECEQITMSQIASMNNMQQYGGTPDEILQLLNEKDDRIEALEKEVETHLELYNRQCEENNRLKERVQELEEENKILSHFDER